MTTPALLDMDGKPFTEGCVFIKAMVAGRSAFLEKRVAHIRDGKLYGSANSGVAIRYPERCLIL